MDGIFGFVLVLAGIAGFIVLIIIIVMHSIEEDKKEKAKIIKLVQQAGGKDVKIRRPIQVGGGRGGGRVAYFDVSYTDVNGERQTRQASKIRDGLGWSLVGDFYWDKPMQMPEPPVEWAQVASKEQIISEKAAEIKRLQEELARAKKELE
jgi:hypothetical protein